MGSNRKTIILIILGIFLAFLPIFTNNLCFIARYSIINSNWNDEFDDNNLKISTVSGKIHINGNSGWAAFKAAGNCTGSGNYTHPYVIEDLVIDGGGSGSCILIENSDVYFRVENCTCFNGGGSENAGIKLNNVTKGKLIINNCTTNYHGIYLDSCDNNTITGNSAYTNTWSGIFLRNCNNSIISGNTAINTLGQINFPTAGIEIYSSYNNLVSGNIANNNTLFGIFLAFSDNNNISGNTVNKNTKIGIRLYESNYNIISGNTLLKNSISCIKEKYCKGNTFSDNGSCTYGQGDDTIPGFNLLLLLCIFSAIAIALLISKKIISKP